MHEYQTKPKAFCKNYSQSEFFCSSRNCQHDAAICMNQTCQCSEDHKKCLLVVASQLIQKLFQQRKQKTQQEQASFKAIQGKIDFLFDKLSEIREQLLLVKQAYGLQKNSILLYANLTNQKPQKVTGKQIHQIRKELRLTNQTGMIDIKTLEKLWEKQLPKFQSFCQRIKEFFCGFQTPYKKIKERITAKSKNEFFYQCEQQKQFPQLNQLIEISKLPKIKNLQIPRPDQQEYSQLIGNVKQLQSLTFGCDEGSDRVLSDKLWTEVLKLNHLKTISFIGGALYKSQKVLQIIRNNKNLTHFSIKSFYSNQNLYDSIFQCMVKNKILLKTLVITCNNAIKGMHLQHFRQLRYLHLEDCIQIQQSLMQASLKSMKKLDSLVLSLNKWVDDETMETIGKFCHSITLLNIYSTSVTDNGFVSITSLNKLSTLICGDNKIGPEPLTLLAKQVHTIRRLSISGLKISDEEILKIDQLCEGITHLDIRRVNRISVDTILKMKALKVVRRLFDEDQKKSLVKAGILVNQQLRQQTMFQHI